MQHRKEDKKREEEGLRTLVEITQAIQGEPGLLPLALLQLLLSYCTATF